MKKIVFFFINPTQISILSNNAIATESLPDTENYYVISGASQMKKYNSVNPFNFSISVDETIILVEDKFDITTLLSSLKKYVTEQALEVYAVFHQATGNEGSLSQLFQENIGTNFKSYISEHEIRGSVYERYLIPLIKGFSKNLFNELVSKFPDQVLEAKLELLHECLVPTGIPDKFPLVLQTAANNEKYKAAYKEFTDTWFGKSDDDVFNPLFIDALTKLRIALLGS